MNAEEESLEWNSWNIKPTVSEYWPPPQTYKINEKWKYFNIN